MNPESGNNDLILSAGEFAFLQDKTAGNVQTHVGPLTVTQSGQLRPVIYRDGRFTEASLHNAVQQCVKAEIGQYVVLHNPTVDQEGLQHPSPKNPNVSIPELQYGTKIVVPGPIQFVHLLHLVLSISLDGPELFFLETSALSVPRYGHRVVYDCMK